MSTPEFSRRLPSVRARKRILAEQDNCCLYCGRRFGSTYQCGGRKRRVVLNWDHLVPWIQNADNSDDNFVAACAVCNGAKGDRLFNTVGEVQDFVARRWAVIEAEAYRPLRGMRDSVHGLSSETPILRE